MAVRGIHLFYVYESLDENNSYPWPKPVVKSNICITSITENALMKKYNPEFRHTLLNSPPQGVSSTHP